MVPVVSFRCFGFWYVPMATTPLRFYDCEQGFLLMFVETSISGKRSSITEVKIFLKALSKTESISRQLNLERVLKLRPSNTGNIFRATCRAVEIVCCA